MASKNVPIGISDYYKAMRERITNIKAKVEYTFDSLSDELNVLREIIEDNKEVYKVKFNLDLDKFADYVNDKYTDGLLLIKSSKLINDYSGENALLLSKLVSYAKKLEVCNKLEVKLNLYDRCLDVNFRTYTAALKEYFNEVHKHMILEGEGYMISSNIGWICINRIKNTRKKPRLDYIKTKRKKDELIAKGIRPYNEEEAAWCRENNLPYDGVDYKVYQNLEYVYEIPLTHCKLPQNWLYRFVGTDYRGKEVRGQSNEFISNLYDNDPNKIVYASCDLRTKLNICVELDKTLYLKYIRNENQESVTVRTSNSKD